MSDLIHNLPINNTELPTTQENDILDSYFPSNIPEYVNHIKFSILISFICIIIISIKEIYINNLQLPYYLILTFIIISLLSFYLFTII